MDTNLANITILEGDTLIFSKQILLQWVNVITGMYVEWEGSPYKMVIEYEGNTVILDPSYERTVRDITI